MTKVRIATINDGTEDRVALVLEGGLMPLDQMVPHSPRDARGLIAEWPRWREAVNQAAANGEATIEMSEAHWKAPVMPGKLLCVGMNYTDHIAQMGGIPEEEIPAQPFPFSFLKPPTAVTGSGASVVRPAHGRAFDWEADLGVVIGDGSAASGPDPMAAVFGYTIVNDLSLRDFQNPFPHFLGLDAVVAKGFDGAAPMGPWITVAQDVPDPQALAVKLTVNGKVMQDGSTAKMIFDVGELIAHYGRVLTLEPGDVLATGTPAGTAAGHHPTRFLQGGDVMEVSIGDLGCLRTVISEPPKEDLLLAEESRATA
jgi:2-keto-4-pentenoate hydratase/2-oxohepta-3-ene-1,7-dioic acid hydratase in catechol pathway